MQKISLIAVLVLSFILISCKEDKNLQTTIIRSNTMECDQCVKTIKKAIYSLEGVKEVNIGLEAKTIEVKYLPLQINSETIEITVTRAGYDANNRKRDPDAYADLPECCKHHK